MSISTEMPVGPMAGYRNTPVVGAWLPTGAEPVVTIHVWPHPCGLFDARVHDPVTFGMSGKTCGFRHWSEARDFFLDRVALQDADRVFKFAVELHEADPTKPKESDPMPATTTKPKRTAKRKTPSKATAGSRRVDPAHSSTAGQPDRQLLQVPIDSIVVVRNDRETFDADELQQLAASIADVGVISPLEVAADPDMPGQYQLIAGERRLRAARIAKLTAVPVIESQRSPLESSLVQLDENLKRADLNPIEKAKAIKYRLDTFGLSQKEMAARLGCTQAQISNQIRLLDLPEIWLQWVASGRLAPTAVRPLVPYAGKRPQVLQRLVDKHASEIDEGGFDLRDYQIAAAVDHCTRPLRLAHYHEWTPPRSSDCWFRYDEAKHGAELDVENIDGHNRAWNVDRWKELNAEPLKKVKDRYKEDQAKRKPDSPSGTKKTPNQPPPAITNRVELESLLCRQLLREFANRLPAKNRHGLQMLLVYCASNECGIDFGESVAKLRGDGNRSFDSQVLWLAKVDAKKWPATLHQLLQQTLRSAAETQWMNEGFNESHHVLRLASDLFDIDLVTDWTPDSAMLDCMSPDWLRSTIGRDALSMPLDDQPAETDDLHAWLVEDWPSGLIPLSLRPLFWGPNA